MPNPINPTRTMLAPYLFDAEYYDRPINLQRFADIAERSAIV
ncbi:MAG: hypothetical protein WBQ03_00775 [Candidatus Sulfotelmatobacter sp.]